MSDSNHLIAGLRVPPADVQTGIQELWQRYRQYHNAEDETQLVEQHLPLVKSVVGRLAMSLPSHVDIEDMHSAGLVGLLQAVRKYDPHSGTSFKTYAHARIRGAVLDELRRMDWVPRLVHAKARKIQNAMSQLQQELGYMPADAQIARALDISLEEYRRWLEEIRPATFVCLDAATHGDNPDSPSQYESIADESQELPGECASRHELARLFTERLQQLPEIQRKVLALYYFEDLRLREIAAVFGLTESRICQIHSQAVLSIRSFIERCEAQTACTTS